MNPAYDFQTHTVEYLVSGDLDGTTLGPAVELIGPDDPQQIHRIDVEGNLGLVNVDYVVLEGSLGPIGNRRVVCISVDSPVAGNAGAVLQVVDGASLVVQETVAYLNGLSTYYNRAGIDVSQGSLLRISGFTNPGGGQFRVRIQSIVQ